jgi:hypothetical protein
MNLIKSRRNYFKKILCRSSNLMALFGVFHVEFDISKSIEGVLAKRIQLKWAIM